MPMTDIDLIARQYDGLGLTPPAGLAYAVQRFRDAQEYVNEPVDDAITQGLAEQTHTRDSLRDAMRESTLEDLLQQNYGRRMQTIDRDCTRIARAALGDDFGRACKELADPYADDARVIVEALQHFQPRDFLDPKKILEREEAATRFHGVQRAMRKLDQIRTLVVSIDSKAINDPAFFVALADGATGDTLPHAAGIYMQHRQDTWVQLFAVPGIVPALHDREGAAVVTAKAAALRAAEPTPKRMPGQW